MLINTYKHNMLRLMMLIAILLAACSQRIPATMLPPTNTAEPMPTVKHTITPTVLVPADHPATASVSPQPITTNSPSVIPTQVEREAIPTITSLPLPSNSTAIVVNHTSVRLFDQIPEEFLELARNLRVIYSNASVGHNLSGALDCLASESWASSPSHCRRDYTGSDGSWRTFNELTAPSRIQFPADPIKYDRGNWVFDPKPGSWQAVTGYFINDFVPNNSANFDVLSYKFTYFMVDESSDITDPNIGFFVEQPDRYDFRDIELLYTQYPDKKFILWTSSLSRSIGSHVAEEFNNRIRSYAIENDMILFDIADILSHTDTGAACFDNRDGVQFCSNNGECENHPDDGLDLPAICQDYTTEIEGGHLGSVSGGKIQLAKAFWVLIARIAGWEP